METNKAAKQPYKSVVPPSNNKPYIMAVMVMALIAVAGVVLIQTLRPEIDNTNIIIEIFGFSAVITTGFFAAMKAQETHIAVNHRLDEWMEKSEALALAQGIAEGAARADARTDMLAHQATSDTVSEIKTGVVEIKIDTGELRRQAAADAKKKSGKGGAR